VNDDQIHEYLRSRGDVTPPSDLASSVVNALADAPQQRRSWFAAFLPVAAVGVAATVLAAAVLARPPDGAPASPPASTSGSFTSSASAIGSPEATPKPTALLQLGGSVAIDAIDSTGRWGTIIVTRGEDLGGFPYAAVAQDAFLITLAVEYQYDREPETEFGIQDWSIETAGGQPIGRVFEPTPPADPSLPLEGQSIGSLPGATVMDSRMGGPVVFEVPRSAANEELVLVYRPSGFDEPLSFLPVRGAGSPPTPVARATAAPTPQPVTYVDQGAPFTVIDSAEADALFATPVTCTNAADGYAVMFPGDWYTNTEVGDLPACSWFGPMAFDVTDPERRPDEVWITIDVVAGVIGYTSLTPVYLNETVELGGRTGHRAEYNADPNLRPEHRDYHYVVDLGSHDRGPSFSASVSTITADDYALGKAVLDRMMVSLVFAE
jgi:hypothetical protein